MKTLNELKDIVHKANEKWWRDINTGDPIARNKGELIALVHSELSESYEAGLLNQPDDHLPQYPGELVELADAKIRLLDYAGGFGYDLKDRHREARFKPTLLAIHRTLSHLLELERKGKPGAAEALTNAIMLIDDRATAVWDEGIYESAFWDKMDFNAKRADHTHEHRAKDGGKKF